MSKLSFLSPFHANATCSPSGENVGSYSLPESVVSGTTRNGGPASLVGEGRGWATLNQVASDTTTAIARAPGVSHHQVLTGFVALPGLGKRGIGASIVP